MNAVHRMLNNELQLERYCFFSLFAVRTLPVTCYDIIMIAPAAIGVGDVVFFPLCRRDTLWS